MKNYFHPLEIHKLKEEKALWRSENLAKIRYERFRLG